MAPKTYCPKITVNA